jgi:DUF2075 family protein
MLVYQNSTPQFVKDVRENKLTEIMANNFNRNTGRQVGRGELGSWQNSLTRVRDLIEIASLDDNMIALEYGCPYNQSRIDCLLFGKDSIGNGNVVLLELKQWTQVFPREEEGNFQEIYEVMTFTGGGSRIVAHPSQQIKGYHNYLKGFIAEFETPPALSLFSSAYCHNYSKEDDSGLFSEIYHKIIEEYPIYTREDTLELANKLKQLLKSGQGLEIFNRFMRSPVKPSKKLLDNVKKVIENEAVFSLLNEQLVAKNLIWAKTRKDRKKKEKSIILVHGGPGTGKSLIAINLLAEAARRKYTVYYGCKSKPFTNGLQKLVGDKGKLLFSNLYRFLPNKMNENELDLLLVDEAHRIEKSSNFQYTKEEDKTDMPQIDQLIRCAKTAVFFIDDKQNVRSQEIGSSQLIREAAEKFNIAVWETTLETQYRCMGSNNYLLWLESVLGYDDADRILQKNEIFEFKIFDSPDKMYDQLKIHETDHANSARIVAGFCWPWSNPDSNGELIKDVVIGNFAMPWEAKEGTKLAKGIPKWFEWAYHPGGFSQVGCIYTAQGFEFDYIGVIVGDDLQYDSERKTLKANIKATFDPTLKKYPANFESHVKNIYRALLTRGMKGCYVYFANKETEAYFKSRIE